MDYDRTVAAGSFAFNARFVGTVDLPALITASMTIYYEASTEVAGNLFLQGHHQTDFPVGRWCFVVVGLPILVVYFGGRRHGHNVTDVDRPLSVRPFQIQAGVEKGAAAVCRRSMDGTGTGKDAARRCHGDMLLLEVASILLGE